MLKKYLIIFLIATFLAGGLFLYTVVEGKINQYINYQELQNEKEMFLELLGQRPEVAKNDTAHYQVGVPILVYHGVLDQISPDDEFNITTQNFKSHISALKEHGYVGINTSQFLDFINQKKGLPAKPVMITFDDGRKDSVLGSHPSLKDANYQAVMFVVTIDQEKNTPFFLSWDKLNMMQDSGYWDIQAHGYHFHDMITINPSGAQGYFASNKEWLPNLARFETLPEYEIRLAQDHLQLKRSLSVNIDNLSINAFAFPFGDFGQHSHNLNPGYATEVNQRLMLANYPISFGFNTQNTNHDFFFYPYQSKHLMTRLLVNNQWSGQELVNILERFQTKELPLKQTVFSTSDLPDWSVDWGATFIDKNSNLVISATNNTTGGMAILNGGKFWQNYTLHSTIDIRYGCSGFVVGHYQDTDNYIYCGIDQDLAILKQKTHGEFKYLGRINYPKSSRRYQISLKFIDHTIECQIDQSVIIVASTPSQSAHQGTIGFKAWDNTRSLSEMRVFDIDVY